MSNRRKIHGGHMSRGADMKAAPCVTCGEVYTLNTALYATALHDCDSGDWFVMPLGVADALSSMNDARWRPGLKGSP